MEIEKAKMMSLDMTQENIRKIQRLFPNAVTEVMSDDGNLKLAIDFDVLKQELSESLISDKQERYQMTWPDKKQSILLANKGVVATLRPVIDKSVDFNNTKNIYIEGDNLDVLKLLRETYLGRVKMIYIDPPYNTGNDFVYNDDFSLEEKDYLNSSGQYDELGNRLFQNNQSNGRFHTDWLNMIYPRLKVAKDLLSDDGAIFISIDDNEVNNLRMICDEIFGPSNFVGQIVWQKKTQPSFLSKKISSVKEYILFYQKSEQDLKTMGGFTDANKLVEMINISNEKTTRILKKENVLFANGTYSGSLLKGVYGNGDLQIELLEDCKVVGGKPLSDVSLLGRFKWTQNTMDDSFAKGDIYHIKNVASLRPTVERKEKTVGIKPILDLFSKKLNDEIPTNTDATNEIKGLFDGYAVMDYPKPSKLMKYLIRSITYDDKEAIVMDFFSGSASTAHGLFLQNIEDSGKRKFILVQLPETIGEDGVANKMGMSTICDLGEERIRRVGKQIKEESDLLTDSIDVGFRVFKLDSSNLNEIYYNPKALTQNLLEATVDNIKPDRNSLDLLFQVMLECGALLSSKIEEREINGKKVYIVEDNYIAACFDDEVDDKTVEAIAKLKPIYACFKGSSFNSDSANINAEQIFKTYSPNTEKIKVI